MAALFAPHLNQSRTEMESSKPNQMFSAISKLGRTLRLASRIGSRSSSQRKQRSHAIVVDNSTSIISNLDTSSRNHLFRTISKQCSTESVSSNMTVVPSTIMSSPVSGTTLFASPEASLSTKRLSLIPSIESLLDVSVAPATQAMDDAAIIHDSTADFAGAIASFHSCGHLFSSESASFMLEASAEPTSSDALAVVQRVSTASRPVNIVIPDNVAAAHECAIHESSDGSSIELSYRSAPSGPSTADTLVDKSVTPASSTIDALSRKTSFEASVNDESSSNADDIVRPGTPPLAESSGPVVQEEPASKATIDWTAQTWTACFEDSDSECSSVCELAFSNDSLSQALATAAESAPSSPTCDAENATDDVTPDEYYCFDMLPSFGMAGEFLMTHIFVPYTSMTQDDTVASIEDLSGSWPVRVLTDILEEDESEDCVECNLTAPNTLRVSASQDSLFAAYGGETESRQFGLPSEASEDSCIGDDRALSLPARPVSRWCMREDFTESDDE